MAVREHRARHARARRFRSRRRHRSRAAPDRDEHRAAPRGGVGGGSARARWRGAALGCRCSSSARRRSPASRAARSSGSPASRSPRRTRPTSSPTQLVARAPLESAEALAELRREEAAPLLPRRDRGRARVDARRRCAADPQIARDDGRWALLHALEAELGGVARRRGHRRADRRRAHRARRRRRAGRAARGARRRRGDQRGRRLARARDRRRSGRSPPLDAPLARARSRAARRQRARPPCSRSPPTPIRRARQFARALAAIEAALLARERKPETGAVAHGGLRIARLRALVRLLDGVRATSDSRSRAAARRRAPADGARAARSLVAAPRGVGRADPRRRCAAARRPRRAHRPLARVDDRVSRRRLRDRARGIDGPRDRVVRSRPTRSSTRRRGRPPIPTTPTRCARSSSGSASSPMRCRPSSRRASSPCGSRSRALGNQLARLDRRRRASRRVAAGTLDAIATELGALARRVFGARQRLGLRRRRSQRRARDRGARDRDRARSARTRRRAVPHSTRRSPRRSIDVARALAARARRRDRARARLARAPPASIAATAATRRRSTSMLPGWVPLSRLLGGFYVVRPIGRGAGGSVLLAVRAERAHAPRPRARRAQGPRLLRRRRAQPVRAGVRADVPRGGRRAARAARAPEPRALHHVRRERAAQADPRRWSSCAARTSSARSKPASSTMPRALAIVDDLLAGLEAMHAVRIAHLDVKPPNLVLREGTGDAVLVDFGLAGRRIRTGCGSAHYGAAEVWIEDRSKLEPFPTDVYAAACVAFEVLTQSRADCAATISKRCSTSTSRSSRRPRCSRGSSAIRGSRRSPSCCAPRSRAIRSAGRRRHVCVPVLPRSRQICARCVGRSPLDAARKLHDARTRTRPIPHRTAVSSRAWRNVHLRCPAKTQVCRRSSAGSRGGCGSTRS